MIKNDEIGISGMLAILSLVAFVWCGLLSTWILVLEAYPWRSTPLYTGAIGIVCLLVALVWSRYEKKKETSPRENTRTSQAEWN